MWRSLPLLLVVILAVPAHAQTKRGEQDFLSTVRECAVSVKDQTDREVGVKLSKFDARVDPDGIVGFVGTDTERLRFKKCLANAGHPIDPLNK